MIPPWRHAPFAAATTFFAASVRSVGRRSIVQPALRRRIFAALLDVGPFQPHDHRHLEADLLERRHQRRGDRVALHDAAEDVDQHAPSRSGRDSRMRNASMHLVLVRAAADVEEVGRLAAVVLDDVHRAHRQAGAVDQAADVAVEADVSSGPPCAARSSAGFSSVSSRSASMSGWRNRALSSKVDLGVERQHLALRRHDQRVDLGQACSPCRGTPSPGPS